MSRRDDDRDGNGPAPARLDEETLSALVRGVFWFTWMTAKFRQAAGLAARLEGQQPQCN